MNKKTVLHNPYIGIWIKPRQTLQNISDKNLSVNQWLFNLVLFAAALLTFIQPYSFLKGFLLAFLVIPIFHALYTLFCFQVFLSGKIFRGKGKFQDIHDAIYWVCFFPIVLTMVFKGLALTTFIFWGSRLTQILIDSKILEFIEPNFLNSCKWITFKGWYFIVFLEVIGEIQGFSILRSFSQNILTCILFLVIGLPIIFLIVRAVAPVFAPIF